MDNFNSVSTPPPIIVGGVGGSGTRAIAALLQFCQVDMGSDLNDSLDEMVFNVLFKRTELLCHGNTSRKAAFRSYPSTRDNIFLDTNALTSHLQLYQEYRGVLSLGPDYPERVKRFFRGLNPTHKWQTHNWLAAREMAMLRPLTKHKSWGLKEPNSHWVLPFLLEALPKLKYVHVTRHGLDMAFSRNQNQLQTWGTIALSREISSTSPQDSFDYWCFVHQRILTLQSNYPKQIYVLNFDALCESPEKETASLLAYLDLHHPDTRSASALFSIPASRNRYLKEKQLNVSALQYQLLSRLGFDLET